jgi:alpha-2-macroglobulin-like protein
MNQRFYTYITTDKPIYKPNDSLYIRAMVLNQLDQTPLNNNMFQNSSFFLGGELEILGPKGDTVFKSTLDRFKNSVLSSKWQIPKDASGGIYKVSIKYKGNGFPSSERTFEIRSVSNPRLNGQIEFIRKGYGAGEECK